MREKKMNRNDLISMFPKPPGLKATRKRSRQGWLQLTGIYIGFLSIGKGEMTYVNA